MLTALDEWPVGEVIEGKRITNLRYVDDTSLIANDEKGLGEMFNRRNRKPKTWINAEQKRK